MQSEVKDLKNKAEQAKDKLAALGDDLDLSSFDSSSTDHQYIDSGGLAELPEEDRERLALAGLDVEAKDRAGTYFMKDTSLVHSSSSSEDFEVLPIKTALDKYDGLPDYYWKLVPVDMDKYTAAVELDLHDGYFIRSRPGAKAIYPVQACLYMHRQNLQQNVHNIIVAEEDSELHIISGCATSSHAQSGLHAGVSEFYIKKNAKITFTMIHNWADGMHVRPRSVAYVEEGGMFMNNYICINPVASLQTYPTVHLAGKNSVARLYSILVGHPGVKMDVGGRTILKEPGSRAEIISRAITNGGDIMARGHLVGQAPDIRAHLECRGLILKGGHIRAIPELEGHVEDVDMSHEAAVGKIAQNEINYLMARGLTEDEATSTIVRGFLSIDMPGLPDKLKQQIDQAVATTDENAM